MKLALNRLRWQRWLKRIGSSFAISLYISIFVLVLFLSWFIPALIGRLWLVQAQFQNAAKRDAFSIGSEMAAGYIAAQRQWPPTIRYLVLGTDEVEGSNRPTVLTDTLILATYHPQSNEAKLLSFPRDLYHPQLETKINALYWYGRERALVDANQKPTTLVKDTFEEMIDRPINEVITISLADVRDLINIMGGIEIDVQNEFTDENFPRSGVDVTVEKDPAVLYETVHFETGPQLMDGETALKFMRSRKANEQVEQGDEARAVRQQQVIAAVASKLQSVDVLGNADTLGRLYRWYADNFMAQVNLFQAGQMAGVLQRQRSFPQVESVSMPLTEYAVATDSATLLVHPPNEKYGQWVFEPVGGNWDKLQQFIQDNNL